MKYYRVVRDGVWDANKHYATICGELLTPSERKKKFPHLADDAFERVEIKKTQTFTSFGARFATEDAVVNPFYFTREEAEQRIYEDMLSIMEIVEKHDPDKRYFSAYIHEEGFHFYTNYFNTLISGDEPNEFQREITPFIYRIISVVHAYSPESIPTSLTICDKFIMFFNSYWQKKTKHALNFFKVIG